MMRSSYNGGSLHGLLENGRAVARATAAAAGMVALTQAAPSPSCALLRKAATSHALVGHPSQSSAVLAGGGASPAASGAPPSPHAHPSKAATCHALLAHSHSGVLAAVGCTVFPGSTSTSVAVAPPYPHAHAHPSRGATSPALFGHTAGSSPRSAVRPSTSSRGLQYGAAAAQDPGRSCSAALAAVGSAYYLSTPARWSQSGSCSSAAASAAGAPCEAWGRVWGQKSNLRTSTSHRNCQSNSG